MYNWAFQVRLRAQAVVVQVLTAPPHTAETFPYEKLAEADVLYMRLHGVAGQSYLYDATGERGGIGQTAFSGRNLPELPMGPKVFLEGCYGLDGPLPGLFYEKGASIVIASPCRTQNRRLTVGPAGAVGLAVVVDWLNNNGFGIGDILAGQEEGYAYALQGQEEMAT